MKTPELQSLPRLAPPAELQTCLRVMASREAQRRRRVASLRAYFGYLTEEAGLLFNNLARPYAVPCAGGLLSTIVLFSLVAPSFAVNRNIMNDVPTTISTQATLEFSLTSLVLPVSDQFDEIMVDVEIDEAGRVVGYSVPRGQAWAGNKALRLSLENTLLYTKFTPATIFGQPVTGKTRITIRRNSVDVQG